MKKLISSVLFLLSAGFFGGFMKAFASDWTVAPGLSNPATGDSTGTMLIIFVVVLIVAGIGIAGVLFMMKSKK